MKGHSRHPDTKAHRSRDGRDLALDLAVGMAVEGFRWVEWNHRALDHTAIHETGRFVGNAGDLLAHLYIEASEDTPLTPDPYVHLPAYSSEAGPALRVAERAGVFRGEGAVLSCTAVGCWRLVVASPRVELEGEHLPRILALAALDLARRRAAGGAP